MFGMLLLCRVMVVFAMISAGFGIILGIVWLKKYAARVNCEKLEVRIGDVEGRKVLIRCKREDGVFVSYLQKAA